MIFCKYIDCMLSIDCFIYLNRYFNIKYKIVLYDIVKVFISDKIKKFVSSHINLVHKNKCFL